MRVRTLEVSGSPWEIGQETGETLRDEIRRNLEINDIPDSSAPDGKLSTFKGVLEEHLPDILEEMRGLADGAGVAPERIYRANMPDYNTELSVDGCTNIAFSGGPDGPILGKNNDGGHPPSGEQEPACARLVRPEGGAALISVHFCASVSVGDGMNAHGVAVGHSSVGSVFKQSDRHVPVRLWSYHALKNSRTTGEFVEAMSARPLRGKGYSHLCLDRMGTVRSLETPCPLVQVRDPDHPDGMYCVNRYFLSPLRGADRRTPAKKANADARAELLDRTFESNTGFDTDAMWSLLRSHERPASICGHGETDGDRADGRHTEYSLVMAPRQGAVFVSHGYACENTDETRALRLD